MFEAFQNKGLLGSSCNETYTFFGNTLGPAVYKGPRGRKRGRTSKGYCGNLVSVSDAFWICRSGRIYGMVVRRNHTPRHSGTLDITCQLTSGPLLDRLGRRQTHASANLCSQHSRMDSLQQRYLALTYVYYINTLIYLFIY